MPAVNAFRKGYIYVISFSYTLSFFSGETAEVRIREAGMSVYGYGEHIGAGVEYLLLPVAVMVVDIKHGNLAVGAEILGSDSRRVEIAEPAECAGLGVMARRPYKRV